MGVDNDDMADRYLIAIASYRRPEGLRRLLDSLVPAVGSSGAEILVVDNDAEGSARDVAVGHLAAPTYVVEPAPGIAEARNRALRHFSERHRGIIFVDDDEGVPASWLKTLATYAEQTGADVVMGPVESVYPGPTPDWVRRGGFVQRPILTTGQELRWASTNNTLLFRDMWVRAGRPRFDPAFSVTGGSDADFFRGISKLGGRIFFCADALIFEDVPADRLSLRWLRRRAIRNGIVDTRVRLKHGDSLLAGLGGAAVRAGYGALFLTLGLLTGAGLQAKPFNSLFEAFGRVAAIFHYRINEYARPSPP
jgi:succinoglycan biosynthesis protein ExoM